MTFKIPDITWAVGILLTCTWVAGVWCVPRSRGHEKRPAAGGEKNAELPKKTFIRSNICVWAVFNMIWLYTPKHHHIKCISMYQHTVCKKLKCNTNVVELHPTIHQYSRYSTRHVMVRTGNLVRAEFLILSMAASYSNFSMTTPDILIFLWSPAGVSHCSFPCFYCRSRVLCMQQFSEKIGK